MQPLIAENNDEVKIDILKHLYCHIHKEMQEYRATEMKVLITIGGMILVIIGWSATKKQDLGYEGLLVLSGGVIFLSILLMMISKQLEKYFFEAAEVINKIEHIFRAFDSEFYVGHNAPWDNKMLFPEAWKNFGKEHWNEPIFKFAKLFTVLLSIFAIFAILISCISL